MAKTSKMEGGGGFHALWFLSSIPLVILLALLLSAPMHHELVFSTYDFIVVAKSCPLARFTVFYAILGIINIIIGSPDHQDAAGHEFNHPVLDLGFVNIGAKEEKIYYEGSDVEIVQLYHGYDEENDDTLGTEDDQDSEEDEEDNDLETRVEEFIAKVTRKWREELLTERLFCIAPT
ncbi:hypothetical protein CXB51_030610 [Gossypium anomalum]|uniref:Uncharacterized protein n=1 Tax=Gossypium anomalum TaxID=47600 RepID=A0A8J6CM42_9ROSI|nr:hypothetical protein CXB51_030610 [Gossypium anomalum]